MGIERIFGVGCCHYEFEETETKSDLEKLEEELDENGVQKVHILDDSDLFAGGEYCPGERV